MSTTKAPEVGTIGWFDLTVGDAEKVRDFYQAVVGWNSSGVDMGGYQDFTMSVPGSGAAVGGVCHARGANAAVPPQWLIYITVADLDQSVARCKEKGGSLIGPIRDMGGGARFCVIRDPAGAVAALYQAG